MEKLLKAKWWKYLGIALLVYTILMGLLAPAPRQHILNETIRNLHFHVPMWFGMFIVFTISLVYSVKYLRKPTLLNDTIASETANIGIVFGILGLVTGSIWAKYTWGSWWNGDPKQNVSAIAMLIYLAYVVLRGSVNDVDKRGKLASVYNIFAFCAMIPLIFIVPRLYDSLHPSNGGNEGFVVYDLDNSLRLIFYPAVLGWTLLGLWIASIRSRATMLTYRLLKLI